jgi:hypothetical protein
MAIKRRPRFDPKSFLAKVGEGRTISKYRKDQVVFSQGELADAVFYVPPNPRVRLARKIIGLAWTRLGLAP